MLNKGQFLAYRCGRNSRASGRFIVLDVGGLCTDSSLDYCPAVYLCLIGFKLQDYCQTVWTERLWCTPWACGIWTVRLLSWDALQGILHSLTPVLLVLPTISTFACLEKEDSKKVHALLLLASRHRVALFPSVPQQHQSFSGTDGKPRLIPYRPDQRSWGRQSSHMRIWQLCKALQSSV